MNENVCPICDQVMTQKLYVNNKFVGYGCGNQAFHQSEEGRLREQKWANAKRAEFFHAWNQLTGAEMPNAMKGV